ncbi:hypothetical protein PY67_09650, partial [Lacticaseibacillus rhamnosus]
IRIQGVAFELTFRNQLNIQLGTSQYERPFFLLLMLAKRLQMSLSLFLLYKMTQPVHSVTRQGPCHRCG